jgi:hypothetical protein
MLVIICVLCGLFGLAVVAAGLLYAAHEGDAKMSELFAKAKADEQRDEQFRAGLDQGFHFGPELVSTDAEGSGLHAEDDGGPRKTPVTNETTITSFPLTSPAQASKSLSRPNDCEPSALRSSLRGADVISEEKRSVSVRNPGLVEAEQACVKPEADRSGTRGSNPRQVHQSNRLGVTTNNGASPSEGVRSPDAGRLGLAPKFEVARGVVAPDAVLVVNSLAGDEPPAEHSFHNKHMLKPISTVIHSVHNVALLVFGSAFRKLGLMLVKATDTPASGTPNELAASRCSHALQPAGNVLIGRDCESIMFLCNAHAGPAVESLLLPALTCLAPSAGEGGPPIEASGGVEGHAPAELRDVASKRITARGIAGIKPGPLASPSPRVGRWDTDRTSKSYCGICGRWGFHTSTAHSI